MPETSANPADIASRYIYSKNDYSSNGVKHSAFVPPSAYPNELSVCIISDLTEPEIWKIGAETRKDKPIKARAVTHTISIRTNYFKMHIFSKKVLPKRWGQQAIP